MYGNIRCVAKRSDNVLSWSYSQKAENSGSYVGHCTLRLLSKDKASFLEQTTMTEGTLKGTSGPIWRGTLNRQ